MELHQYLFLGFIVACCAFVGCDCTKSLALGPGEVAVAPSDGAEKDTMVLDKAQVQETTFTWQKDAFSCRYKPPYGVENDMKQV